MQIKQAVPQELVYRAHNIDTGLNYTTIQEAINAPETLEGHTIFVEAGIYYEHIIVNKAVSLVAEDRSTTIIDGNYSGTVVNVTIDNAQIFNFTIRNSDHGPEYREAGILLSNTSGNKISGNNLFNNSVGISVKHSRDNILENNNIPNNELNGIELYQSTNNTIDSNIITNNAVHGIYFAYSTENVVERNLISNNSRGIYLSVCFGPNNITENVVTNNTWWGININCCYKTTLRRNELINNLYNFGVRGLRLSHFLHDVDSTNTVNGKPVYYWIDRHDETVPYDAGYVALVNCTNIEVTNVSLTNKYNGILLAHTTDSSITDIESMNNQFGIDLEWSSNNNISHNELSNNLYGVLMEYSKDNVFDSNMIQNCRTSMAIYDESDYNIFRDNNIENSGEPDVYGSICSWDD